MLMGGIHLSNTQVDTAKQIFLQARRFRNAGNLISQALSQTNDVDMHIGPIIVNKAFATELYLKCIYYIEKGRAPKKGGHDLGKLFRQLSNESRDTISGYFEALNSMDPLHLELKKHVPELDESLEKILDAASHAFVSWRYNYEYKPTSFQSSSSVLTAMEICIFQYRPEWNDTPQLQT